MGHVQGKHLSHHIIVINMSLSSLLVALSAFLQTGKPNFVLSHLEPCSGYSWLCTGVSHHSRWAQGTRRDWTLLSCSTNLAPGKPAIKGAIRTCDHFLANKLFKPLLPVAFSLRSVGKGQVPIMTLTMPVLLGGAHPAALWILVLCSVIFDVRLRDALCRPCAAVLIPTPTLLIFFGLHLMKLRAYFWGRAHGNKWC